MLLLLELVEQLIIQSGTLHLHQSILLGDNRITARNECVNDPASNGFSSVNVTWVNLGNCDNLCSHFFQFVVHVANGEPARSNAARRPFQPPVR